MNDINNLYMVLLFFAGIILGPITSRYAHLISIKIKKRDEEYIDNAKKNGEEIMDLPEGYDLYKNYKVTVVLVSVILGAIFITINHFLGFNVNCLLSILVAAILVAISIVDFQVYEIPIECNIAILVLGLVNLIINYKDWALYLIGFGAVSLIFLLVSIITKGKMGGGDIKLMATLGLFFGWKLIILTMVLGCILGSIIHGIAVVVLKKSSVLAFGPYLSLAAIISMCYGNQLIEMYLSLFKVTM